MPSVGLGRGFATRLVILGAFGGPGRGFRTLRVIFRPFGDP